jgi:hypothetical protein
MNLARTSGTASALVLLVLTAAFSLVCASGARANFEFDELSLALQKPDGTFTRQAGEHADLQLTISTPFNPDASPPGPAEAVHSIDVDLPPGLVGDVSEVATCEPLDLAAPGNGAAKCPVASQVGIARVIVSTGNPEVTVKVGIFNVAHGPEVPARFGFNVFGAVALISPRVRPSDYGITAGSLAISQGAAFRFVETTFWGVPADPVHDTARQPEGIGQIPGGFNEPSPIPASTKAARVPFMTLPTRCETTPLSFTARADSWEHLNVFDTGTLTADKDGTPLVIEGCEKLPFAPSAALDPESSVADSPTGLDVEIEVPQSDDPYGLATAHVRKVAMTFPQGMTVSASSAQGLGSCSPQQISIGTNDAPQCPGSSKLGTVTIDTPLLTEPLLGSVYLAKQNDNPFNSLLALYIAAKGPGFYLKLPGKVESDPLTGQLTTVFDNNPQQPFSKLHLHLTGGPRAALSTPRKCGTYTVRTVFTSWASEKPVISDSSMKVDQGCSAGSRFNPGLRAGTTDPTAGDSSSFILRVTRQDGEQNLAGIDVTLPEGLLAKLAGVPLCGDAQAATGDCPAVSQVGRTIVGAGAGPNPVYVPEAGKAPTAAYLAGPYKGAPYSIVVKVPAQAGPFDLGTVAVRSGIYVDPVTARASVKSDTLPQILQGIPIAYRDVRVEVDRPGFIQTPTGCEAMKVESTIHGSDGATASPTASFKATDCGLLGFKPKLALKFTGPTHRSAHPALKATLTMPKGGANIGKAVVTLPETEFLENAHIGTICTRVQYAAEQCPAKSVYGYAKAWTPLLDKPLQGPVYLRSSNHTLPDLVASLDGQIHVDLAGRIDSPGGKIRNTFWAVPDAPVSKFVLTMKGGDKGLLVNNEELCKAKPRARAEFTGQNGKRSVAKPLVKLDCGKSGKRRK